MVQKGNDIPKERATILVVDDEPLILQRLQEIFHDAGHHTEKAVDGKEALDILARCPIDLMLLDLELPRVSGMEVLRRSMASYPRMPVIIFSGKGTIQSAVEASQLGIFDFLEKPVDRERILITVRNALDKLSLQRERDRLLEDAFQSYQMVGGSMVMQEIYGLIERAAQADSKVLIFGESGTGKEVVAHAIHRKSERMTGPFIAVNCAALPEDLIESELFGYEKGAFTGAHQAHRGKFELADGGTLFLDEVGDMSPGTQAKVLRVLEAGQVMPLAGTAPRPINVRLVAATNKDLRASVQAGTFRKDLYFRLNVLPLRLPALRERREDIPALIDHFLLYFWKEEGLPLKHLARDAQTLMIRHDWPGNIRELRNVIERVIVLSDADAITAADIRRALSESLAPARPSPLPDRPFAMIEPLQNVLNRYERDYILQALIANDWKRQETADALQIDRTYLWRKMQRYHIKEPTHF